MENDLGASLYFFKALDEGDPENKIEFRDALFQWDYPFNNDPQLILKTNNRLSNVVWGNNDIAIATDIWWNNRCKNICLTHQYPRKLGY